MMLKQFQQINWEKKKIGSWGKKKKGNDKKSESQILKSLMCRQVIKACKSPE